MNYHVPVLLNESISGLSIKPTGTYIDLTFGGGGHTKYILKLLEKKGKLFSFDTDADSFKINYINGNNNFEDGFTMSVQAGESLYSSPRDVADKYEQAEVGFPSSPEPLITKYAEDWEVEGDDDQRLCDTVYPYVPVELIDEVIRKHGGIDEDAIELLKGK